MRRWRGARVDRARAERHDIASMWGRLILVQPAENELSLHAQRVARLNRIIDIGEDTGNAALVARAQALLDREAARHARVMEDIRIREGVE